MPFSPKIKYSNLVTLIVEALQNYADNYPCELSPTRYVYAVQNIKTGEIVNRKSQSCNPFYTSYKRTANQVSDDNTERVAKFLLVEIKDNT